MSSVDSLFLPPLFSSSGSVPGWQVFLAVERNDCDLFPGLESKVSADVWESLKSHALPWCYSDLALDILSLPGVLPESSSAFVEIPSSVLQSLIRITKGMSDEEWVGWFIKWDLVGATGYESDDVQAVYDFLEEGYREEVTNMRRDTVFFSVLFFLMYSLPARVPHLVEVHYDLLMNRTTLF